jgi:hypothetical protein
MPIVRKRLRSVGADARTLRRRPGSREAETDDRFVHELQFSAWDRLSRAFQEVASSNFVEACLVEVDQLQLRFVACSRPGAELVERFSLNGGLKLYRRYRFTGGPSAKISPRAWHAKVVWEREARKARKAMKRRAG